MRILVTLVIVCLAVVTSTVMAAEPSDSDPPRAFAVWERPAAGIFVGVSGISDPNSREEGSPELGLVFDTPVVFGIRVRADASRTKWLFGGDPSRTTGPRDIVTLESVRLSVLRVRQINSRTSRYAGGGYGGYRYSYATLPLRKPWRGGLHGLAGIEVTNFSQRWAFNGELRIHAVNGTNQPPVASLYLYKVDAALGLKLRF